MNIEEREELVKHSHAVFQQISKNIYRVEKDMLNKLSAGSKIDKAFVEYYKSIVPDSTRITIFECELENKE